MNHLTQLTQARAARWLEVDQAKRMVIFLSAFVLAVIMLLLPIAANAQEASLSVGTVKTQLINQLEADGVISQKAATEARTKYIAPSELQATVTKVVTQTAAEPSIWEKYVTWANFLKTVAVILLLVAFHGFIFKFCAGLVMLIIMIPKEVYQTIFAAALLSGLIDAKLYWNSPHSFYLSLFSGFALPMVLVWIIETHPGLKAALKKIALGFPDLAAGFWAAVYFGVLAVNFQSQLFGFASVVGLSAMMSFGVGYFPGVLWLDFKSKMLHYVTFGHLAIIVGYVLINSQIIPIPWLHANLGLFKAGIEYYATIALGCALLFGASPWRRNSASIAFYTLLFIVVAIFASLGFHVYGYPVIGSILMVFFVLFLIEWIGYISFSAHWILGTAVTGLTLYGLAHLFETYGKTLVFFS